MTKPNFELTWKHYAGMKNQRNETLTLEMIKIWCESPNPEVECEFCGNTQSFNTMDILYCHKCREYKGLIPYIPEWSDWA
jgi:Zn finger protein HypA/HybF involved in hydrogenase expression